MQRKLRQVSPRLYRISFIKNISPKLTKEGYCLDLCETLEKGWIDEQRD